jgi:glycosyltransferase involved in cell wall biosynthesis
MTNIAFFIYGINKLDGGGGAERFFSDFFDEYQKSGNKKFGLYFITDKTSANNLHKVGKLKSNERLLFFKIISNRFKKILEVLQLYKFIFIYSIKIIHIPLYDLSYLPLLKAINNMPRFMRPKMAINIVNCYAAPALEDKTNRYHESISTTYLPLFKEVKADGYFCWNTNFEAYLKNKATLARPPKTIQSITSRFSDVKNYYPEKIKNNWVVFASRLDEQKHPEWIVEAVKEISAREPNLLNEWKFKICGDGILRNELMAEVEKQKLNYTIDFEIQGEMFKILNASKIYVSCQDYDNFPSLTMAEAMASGNAIIARCVGQTDLFVKNKKNGLLITPDSPLGLANALIELMKDQETISSMRSESLKLIRDVHNVPNFITQIHHFWQSLLN